MRICLVNYRYFVSSGAERYLFGVKRLLEERGHEVIPFSIRYRQNEPTPWSSYFVAPIGADDQVFFRQHSWDPATVRRSLERAVYSREVYDALARLLRDTRPDVAFVLNYVKKLSPSVLVALHDAGVPIVVRFSDFALVCPQPHLVREGRVCELCVGRTYWPSVVHRCVQGSLGASLVNALAMTYARRRGFFDLVDAFVAPSEIMREKMVQGGLPEAKLHHIPTFVAVPDGGSREPGNPRRICFVGRLEPTKGVEVLVDAFRLLRRRDGMADLELVLAGEANTARGVALQQRLAGLELPGLRLTGSLDEEGVRKLLRSSALSVVPSLWYENTPNALLESLACGTPVVASDLGSMRAMLDGTGAGALFRPGDAGDLAHVLAELLERPGEPARMGRRARELARERYAPQAHVEALEALFADVTSHAGERARAEEGAGS